MADQNGTGAPKRRAKLEREPGTVRPRARGRVERADGGDDDVRRARGEDEGESPDGRRGRGRDEARGEDRGRPAIMGEVGDLNRSFAFVGLEAAAIAMDVASRVLRGAIDRAFDEDYAEPGDLVRGVANEADLAAFDLIDEVRQVPRQLSHRFESSLRSPRADKGERRRRAADAATPADSPERDDRAGGLRREGREVREGREDVRRRPD